MFLALLKGFFSLLGLQSWAEKLWGEHKLKEQGKEDLTLQQQTQAITDAEKANAFEDRVINDDAFAERVRKSTNPAE